MACILDIYQKIYTYFLHRNKFQVTGILDNLRSRNMLFYMIGSNATEIRLFVLKDGICSLFSKKTHYNGKDPDVDMQPNTVADAFFDNASRYVWYAYTDICRKKILHN